MAILIAFALAPIAALLVAFAPPAIGVTAIVGAVAITVVAAAYESRRYGPPRLDFSERE